jgi:hypothetical protein
MAALKRAVADGIEKAPNLAAQRNVMGQMFESVELIRSPGFDTGSAARGGVVPSVPGPDPRVTAGEATYWLLPKLRPSAADAPTPTPTGQLTPVPASPQYPNGFLCRYCWW